ncbi:MAG: PAS domain-containing protein [Janthinobacterium lividum]
MDAEISPTLIEEAARLAVLDELEVLDTSPERAYDDLTALAAFVCGTPMSLFTLVGEDRQLFKSAHNFPISETSRDQGFCAHILGAGETLVVEDASQDVRFAQNPLVVKDPSIRFYAGAPVLGEGGDVLGTLCVMDQKPRTLAPEQKQALETLARQASEILHQRFLVRQLQRSGEELQTKTLQLGLAVEAGKLGVYTWDVSRDATVWENDRMYEIFGRTREQGSFSTARFLSDIVLPEDRQSFIDAGATVKQLGDRLRWIGRLHHPDGAIHWIEILGLAEMHPQGELILVGTVADITEKKCEELAAQVNRERLEFALEGSEASTFDWFPGKDFIHWGGVMPFGHTAEQMSTIVGVLEIIHPEDRTKVTEALNDAVILGKDYACDFRAFWPDGFVHWVRGIGRLLHADNDAPRRFVGVNFDVTALKLAEQELFLERERLELALKSTKATTFEWLPDSDLITWSGMPPFGINPKLIPTGASSLEYVYVEDRDGLKDTLLRALERDEDYAFEYRCTWEDGSARWVRTAGRPMKDAQGRTRFLGVNTDITEHKLAVEALLQSEKLAAVGRLASVISHEINNPLEAVTNLLYIVRMSERLSQEDRNHLELADRELARVGQITAQTLRFHRNIRHPRPVDAAAVVHELLALYNTRLTASNIEVRQDLGENVTFSAFEGDVRQVLNNLVGNAFDAMRTGGTLHVRTRFATDPKTGQKGAAIAVGDTGSGIPAEAQQRIFQAFQSTKGIHGTGLGLWISKRIAHKHRGHLWFRSSTGERHGTVFRLWFPLDAATAAAEEWT